MEAINATHVSGLVEEILSDVATAADKLEQRLDDHVFEDAIHNPILVRIIATILCCRLFYMVVNYGVWTIKM